MLNKNRKKSLQLMAGVLAAIAMSSCSNSSNLNIVSKVPDMPERAVEDTNAILTIDFFNGQFGGVSKKLFHNNKVDSVTITGWAIDAQNKSAFGEIYAIVGKNIFKNDFTEDRPDVMSFKGLNESKLGFKFAFPASYLSTTDGQKADSIKFVLVAKDKSYKYQPMGYQIIYPASMPSLPHSDAPAQICIDGVNNAPKTNDTIKVQATSSTISIVGWAVDPQTATSGGDLYVTVAGNTLKAEYGYPRPDVKQALKLADETVGFKIDIPEAALTDTAGNTATEAEFTLITKDGNTILSSSRSPLSITQ